MAFATAALARVAWRMGDADGVARLDDAMEAAEAAICVFAEVGGSHFEDAGTGALGSRGPYTQSGTMQRPYSPLRLAEARARKGEDGLELARSAIRILERMGRPSELAEAWCRLGQIALLDGDQSAAENALSRALEAASGIEREPTVRHAIDRLRAALAEQASGGTETP